MRVATPSLSTTRAVLLPVQPRILQRSHVRLFPLPAAASVGAWPTPRPARKTAPTPLETARHTYVWRAACRKLVQPMMRAYEGYAENRLLRAGFSSTYVHTPQGVTMHAIRVRGGGPRPPIVFIHGLSGSVRSYYDMLLRLKNEFREVIAIDLPGHGSSLPYPVISPASFIGAVANALDKLLRTPTIVFGHSLGGFVATHYASRRPEKVAALVLAAPAGGPMPEDQRQEMIRLFEVRTHRDAITLAGRTFAPPSWKTQLFAAGTTTRFANPDLQRLVHSPLSGERLPRSMLRTLQPPTLFVWGEHEQLMPAEHFDYFRKHLPPGTKVKRLPGVNHSSIATAASPVVAELLKFTQRPQIRQRAVASPSTGVGVGAAAPTLA